MGGNDWNTSFAGLVLSDDGQTLLSYEGDGGAVSVPMTVRTIGERAFAGNQDIASVHLPSSVRTVDACAFMGCRSLEGVHMKNVFSLGRSAFEGCASLREVSVASLSQMGEFAFSGCASLEKAPITWQLVRVPASAFAGCCSLRRLSFPVHPRHGSLMRDIGPGAFANCVSLQEADLPEGLESIGAQAFFGCSALERVRLPRSLHLARHSCFLGCPDLTLEPSLFDSPVKQDENMAGLLCDDTRASTLARAVLCQHGRGMKRQIDNIVLRCPQRTTDIVDELVLLLGTGEASLENWAAATEFVLRNADAAGPRAVELFMKASRTLGSPCIEDMEMDTRLGNTAAGPSGETAADPALAIALRDWEFTEDLAFLRHCVPSEDRESPGARARSGVEYADGSGNCHPDALAHVVARIAACDPAMLDAELLLPPPGSVDEIVSLLHPDHLLTAIQQLGWMVTTHASSVIPALAYFTDGELGTVWNPWYSRDDDWDLPNRFMHLGRAARHDGPDGSWDMRHACFRNAQALDEWVRASLDLDESGRHELDLGGQVVIAQLVEGAPFALIGKTGGRLRSLPKCPGNPEARRRASEWLRKANKELSRVRQRLIPLLKGAMMGMRRFDARAWKVVYLGHPEYRAMAKALVWQQGPRFFTLGEDGPCDASGAAVLLGTGPILLAHPVDMGAEEVQEWQEYFSARNIRQPFVQMLAPRVDVRALRSDRYRHVRVSRQDMGCWSERTSEQALGSLGGISMDGCCVTFRAVSGTPADTWELGDLYVESTHRGLGTLLSRLDHVAARALTMANDMRVLTYVEHLSAQELSSLVDLALKSGSKDVASALLEYGSRRFEGGGALVDLAL